MLRPQSTEFGTEDKDLCGFLSKRNSIGFYQNRYVITDKHLLQYWTDQSFYENKSPPRHYFDISDIREIETTRKPRNFIVYFLNSKFRLDFTAPSQAAFMAWTNLLEAKRKLYNVDTLLERGFAVDDGTVFQTKLFENILMMKEKHQTVWILNRMDDHFNPIASNPNANVVDILQACYRIVDDFSKTCEECKLEVEVRNPKINAHCRFD